MFFIVKVLFLLPGLVLGLTVHEASHALTAKWLGDGLSQRMGRISLNPLRHLSLWGTLALFVLGFGWGKPVPVNIYNFKRPKLDYLICSLAGPVSNVFLCVILLGVLYLKPGWWVEMVIAPMFLINAILAVVNLLPIPPLDGSKIWPCVIPGMRPVVSGKWSTLWVVVLIVGLYSGAIDKVILPTMSKMEQVMGSALLYSPRPKDFPEVLKAPQEAYDKNYYVNPYDVNRSNWCLRFRTDEPYPAHNLISFFEKNLIRHQFHPLAYQLSDPNKLADTHWQLEDMGDPNLGSWKKGWINNQGELIVVTIEYMPAVMGVIYIDLFKGIPETWYLIEYRNKHPEEFERSN